ncbi:hypothetical protein ILYODFUR_035974 [Ilyodon furcidens]|uniref:Uncharacterized protein n=1 Tax=Ilyodon furcidens TaxID=33524 RepID=A0ABV0VKD2_9TELE
MGTALRGYLVESKLLFLADLVFFFICQLQRHISHFFSSVLLLLSVSSPHLTTNLNTSTLPQILTSFFYFVSEWRIDVTVLPPPCPSVCSPVPHLLVWLHPSLSSSTHI